jgi:hypothetical protein
MKVSAVIVSRNDNYGGNLLERSTYCLNSAINTYDEVFYIDWNSPTHSLLYDIKDNLQFKGNLKHIVISPEIASIITNYLTSNNITNFTKDDNYLSIRIYDNHDGIDHIGIVSHISSIFTKCKIPILYINNFDNTKKIMIIIFPPF